MTRSKLHRVVSITFPLKCDLRRFLARRRIIASFAFALLAYIVLSVSALTAKSDSSNAVYSEAQAARGRGLYVEHCAACHGMMLEGQNSVPLSGVTFQARWADEKHTVDDLFYIVRTLMPYRQPATLTKQDYVDIVAYILMMNRHPAGNRDLPTDPAVLKEIIIRPQPQLP
ncbi:MAG: cytochrome c [Bradyrhizobium sp.]|nr:cytochrome c [Bradyrhizobium sp.]